MLFIVRGKNNNTDAVLRIEAGNAAEAEAIAWKHGMFVTEVTSTDGADADPSLFERIASGAYRIWRYVPTKPLICFGKPVSGAQSAALIFLGVTTWVVQLRNFHLVSF
jgi:hypothetical protein